MIPGMRTIVFASLALVLAAPAAAEPLRVPLGLDAGRLVVPADNPMTPEKVELGKQIFFDQRWSRSKTVSCASCHLPEHGWADPRRFSVRADGKLTPRHSPTLVNRAFGTLQQWTGARRSLEDQAIKSSDSDPATVVRHLGPIPGYQAQFQRVFGTAVTAENVAKAIAAFERTILSGNAPYDRFLAGERQAMSASATRGFAVFVGKARCAQCHAGANFTDEGFHNLGVGMDAEKPDLGLHDEPRPRDHQRREGTAAHVSGRDRRRAGVRRRAVSRGTTCPVLARDDAHHHCRDQACLQGFPSIGGPCIVGGS